MSRPGVTACRFMEVCLIFDIVIPSYGRCELLGRTLRSVVEQASRDGLHVIWVVENGPRAGAERVCGDFHHSLPVRYLYREEPGAADARNAGLLASEADFILFIDNDIKLCDGTLVAYGAAFSKYGDRAFFGGPLTPEYDVPPPDWLCEFLPPSAKGFSLGDEEVVVDAPVFLGGNIALPRERLVAMGGFRGPAAYGSLGGGLGEETRLQSDLLNAGLAGVYVPRAEVLHHVPADRCDMAFAMHRGWRYGLGNGHLYAAEGYRGRTFMGKPAWFWRQRLVTFVALARAYMDPRSDRADRFRQRLKARELAGWAAGYEDQSDA